MSDTREKAKAMAVPYYQLLTAFVIALIYLFVLYHFISPRWETNDDVGMSMVAHGYGVALTGSPNLVFSNVLWGYLVRAIPQIHGVLGYSIATLCALVIVGTVVIDGLYKLGLGYIGALSSFVLMLTRPILFPQFTINAGLLMVAAVICICLYSRQQSLPALLAACLLAFLSFLVRSEEFLLVLIVAVPLIPWRILFSDRPAKIAAGILISALAVSALIDRHAYSSDEWVTYNELKPAISAIVDFGAGENLKLRPDILRRFAFSINDIDLIRHWFFVDPTIANPQKLNAMLKELGPSPFQENAVSNALTGVRTLYNPLLLTTLLAALLLSAFRPCWQIVISWGLCIAAVFALGLLGRPGVLRVYVPLICLLLVAPLLKCPNSIWRKRIAAMVLSVAAAYNGFSVISNAQATQVQSEHIRSTMEKFTGYPVFNWGSKFPFEEMYPVLGISTATLSNKIYSLGGFTLAPFSFAYAEQQQGRGLTKLLMDDKGISIIAREPWLAYLDIYCSEHFHASSIELAVQTYGSIKVSQRRCEIKDPVLVMRQN